MAKFATTFLMILAVVNQLPCSLPQAQAQPVCQLVGNTTDCLAKGLYTANFKGSRENVLDL